MKPVKQTLFGKGEGNCVSACIATILAMSIEDVPNFAKLYNFDWAYHLEEWLSERGYAMISLLFENGSQIERMYMTPNLYVMMSGLSPRAEDGDTMRHAVVGLTDGRGIMLAHDPHPSGDGILMTHEVWVRFIVPKMQYDHDQGVTA
jgi:hypothetical protein